MKQRELEQIIEESIQQFITENEMEEGFLGNMWNGIKNAGNQAGQAVGNAANNQWNKVKDAGYRAGQAMAQGANSMKAAYNAGAAQNAQRDVEAQIAKSQEIINREQEKINQLRGKMNSYVQKSNNYANMANKNAANRGMEGNYQGSNIETDNRTKDFYNDKQMQGQRRNAVMNAGKRRKANNNSMRTALEESTIDKIISDVLNEIKNH